MEGGSADLVQRVLNLGRARRHSAEPDYSAGGRIATISSLQAAAQAGARATAVLKARRFSYGTDDSRTATTVTKARRFTDGSNATPARPDALREASLMVTLSNMS
eukprot:2817267-Pyramimonas_sp.AAC.1